MINKTFGFIGGGRITQIMLAGLNRVGRRPQQVVVSDVNIETLSKLQVMFPQITITPNDNKQAASADLVFIALHPPLIGNIMSELKANLKPEALLISLAPKLTIAKLSAGLDGFQRIVRMIPNAPSIVNAGYNPVAFGPGVTEAEKEAFTNLLNNLGECPEVAEDKLEAYAILTAMGPTYLWFQLYELQNLGRSFGLTELELSEGLSKMTLGAVKTMRDAGLASSEVMDLVPVKPLGDAEENIRSIYQSRLEPLFQKLKVN